MKFVGSTATASCTVDVIPIAEGAYYLRNWQNDKYVDIEGPTMANGTEIHQWEFHGGNSQKWIFEYHGSGYYSLKSANSTTAYYLGVKDDLDTEETPIVLRSGTITDGMLWRALTTTSGAYRLTPKTGNWCLATTVSTQTNGDKLHQDWYAENTSYRDEWYLAHTSAIKPLHIPSTNFTIQCVGDAANPEWYPLILDAVNAWNDSAANTNISLTTSTAATADYFIEIINNSSVEGGGLTSYLESDGDLVLAAKIEVNIFYVSDCQLERRCVIAHEIGHLLGLSDFPPTENSLMSYDHNCLSFYVPQTFDENNVKFIYNID